MKTIDMKISIVCCVTDIDVFDENLLKSFNNMSGKIDIEIVPVFNLDKKIQPISAINTAIDKCTGDWIIISHQDVSISDKCWLKTAEYLNNIDHNVAMVGYAGISLGCTYLDCDGSGLPIDKSLLVGSVSSSDKIIWGGSGTGFVHCVDEFCFIIKNNFNMRLSHNGTMHHYAADLALRIRSAGMRVVAISTDIIHNIKHSRSSGTDAKFYASLLKTYQNWHVCFPELLMPHSFWSGNLVGSRIPFSITSGGITSTASMQLVNIKDD